MKIGLIAMSGIRVCDTELLELGLTLPGFVERSKVIASLPSLGLLTVNVLTAADEVLVPLKTDFLATRGLDALVDVVAQVKERLNPNLNLLGIVPTMVTRRAHSIKVLEQVRAKYPDKLLDVSIKDSASFPEAPDHHQTIFEIDHPGEGADEYRALAEWLIQTEQPAPTENQTSNPNQTQT